ncbi:MAG: SagB/ThcOx family dehydrogenase [Lentimicrobiaceae bacterium]|nr:SagB/ThcOx family dehydrogenase [Lentimicrobiaceae bacterium]
MKKIIFCFIFTLLTGFMYAQNTIVLNPPDLKRGLPVMTALSLRASATEFDTAMISLRDLSDLLWASNGINRPESDKRTAPSAMNAQDIDVYVCMKTGIYLYDVKNSMLNLIAAGDYRKLVAVQQEFVTKAPVICLLVSDISRFPHGEESLKMTWAAEDAGMVSQNISLFCASAGLSTRPRAYMDQDQLKKIMKLKESQHLMLNHPVSYKK